MTIADRIKIIEPLSSQSSGKFGKIFKGVIKDSGEEVVIKALAKENTDTTAIERLRNEAQYSFHESGLPKIVEYFESDTECILIRNYTHAITIDKFWIKLKRRERLAFLIDLLNEFDRLQRILKDHNVVHCDIRPGNMLIEKNEKISLHIIDFGIAINTNNPEKRDILFPLGYAAPELLLNRLSLVSEQTDQFSLGIVIWRLYTGKLPLTHPNPGIFTNLQLTHPLPNDSDLPRGLYEILLKMTNKHQFRIPPNKMNLSEVDTMLNEAINGRYSEISDAINDLNNLPRRFYQKRSFR